jgi:hypothetical protein
MSNANLSLTLKSTDAVVIQAEDGRVLLRINFETGEVTGEIEDAGDAARIFMTVLRQMMKP